MSPSGGQLPDIGKALQPILQRVAPAERPLLIAVAERLAAERYRGWASQTAESVRRERLLACAAREEDIARRVEALHAEAALIQARIVGDNPELSDVNRSLFAGLALERQFAIQAAGERLGAATWRSFARGAESPARETFLACAELEEASAAVLESILRGEL